MSHEQSESLRGVGDSRVRVSRTRSATAGATCALLALVFSVLVGCERIGCSDEAPGADHADERPWLAQSPVLGSLSTKASVIVGLRRLTAIGHVKNHIDRSVSSASPIEEAVRGLATHFDGMSSDRLRAQGVAHHRPVVLFRELGSWMVSGEIRDRKSLTSALSASGTTWGEETESVRSGSHDDRYLCLFRDHFVFQVTSAASTDAFEGAGGFCGRFTPRADGPLSEEWTDGWTRSAEEASLLKTLIGGNEVGAGIVRADQWLASPHTRGRGGHAATLTRRLANQLGSLGWTMHHHPKRRLVSITMRLQQASAEPMAVADLGSATGSLPELGHFVDPDTLGSVRLSADPQLTYQLGRSLLPAQRRRQLDDLWAGFNKKLSVEMPQTLIHTISGHAVVAIFDVRRRERVMASAESNDETSSVTRAFLTGDATREAVMIPISNREDAERILNVATQLSQGKLSRDRGKHSVHYAWIGERGLSWAMVLTDRFVIFADSGTAFNRAVNFARDEVPIGGELRGRGVDRLFEGVTRSGFYLDARRARRRLTQGGWKGVAAWMQPIEWLLFTSETAAGEGIGRIDVGYAVPPDKQHNGAGQTEIDAGG